VLTTGGASAVYDALPVVSTSYNGSDALGGSLLLNASVFRDAGARE